MANGIMPYLLMSAAQVYKGQSPSSKITPTGTLKYLIDNGYPNDLSGGKDDGLGHIRDVKIRYSQRDLPNTSSTSDDCQINAMPVRTEATVDMAYFRKKTLFIPDETIAAYENEASQTVAVGKPMMGLTKEMWESVIRMANALFADVNSDLLAKIVSNVGVNAATGLSTAKTLNFALDGTQNALTSGMNELVNDIMLNEMNAENVALIGSGLINNYYLNQSAKSFNQSGLNTALQFLPKLYHDVRATTAMGANKFVAVDKNSAQLIKYCRFRGFKGGNHLTSLTGTVELPVVDSYGDNQLASYEFDYQLKYNDCPQTVDTDVYGYGGSSHAIGRGWYLTLMTSYDVFLQPSDVYAVGDRLRGNNGILLYTATNL